MANTWPIFGLDPIAAKILFCLVFGGFSAFLMNKSIATFHDGLRPVLPEFIEGRMGRAQLTSISLAIGIGFVLGWAPFTLTTGLILVGLILLPVDSIGAAAPKWWIAVLGGGAWGALVSSSLEGIQTASKLLPVDILAALASLATPLTFAFVAFPVVAVGYQFGWKKGLIALTVAVIARQLLSAFGTFKLMGNEVTLSPDGAAMLFGMGMLIIFAIQKDRRVRKEMQSEVAATIEVDEDGEGFFGERSARIYKSLPLLAIQGAIIAFGIRAGIVAWQPTDVMSAAAGKMIESGILSLALAFGFLPLIATTALTTGVYGTVGLCFAVAAGYFSPNPYVALIAGGVVAGLEVVFLRQIGKLLDQYQTLRESAESLRLSMDKVVTYALLAGSMVAGNQLIPGGTGYFLVAGLFVLNEFSGQKLMPMAAAPAAAIITGILANIFVLIGWM
ncbi:transporter [Bacillus sp. V3-13]|uniref:YhfT family protein n=1 Tax=Bacillus sp. V3-13 TaxID=2053728 RepID=UPI000C761603|nr:YhfT family protein [Bacillus sp. V3-13]PLR77065.1 transporter [Bacillus sp. V3-13]